MPSPAPRRLLDRAGLDALIGTLIADGRRVIGPRVRDGVVDLGVVRSTADLPEGATDTQLPGAYRLERRGHRRLFDAAVGPSSMKAWLHPARTVLFRSRRTADGVVLEPPRREPPRLAFLGVRACDLAALRLHDRVLRDGDVADPTYAMNRADVLIVAVQCGRAVATCFCAAMDAGPRVTDGHDLALTELDDGRFVVETGSEAGAALLARLPTGDVAPDEARAPEAAAARARADQADRGLPPDLPRRLHDAVTSPRWDEVTARCFGCTGCTSLCPTCFCTTVADTTSLDGTAERVRTWDSCFTLGFSFTGGAPARASLAARYRQWLTHKLSTWWDQFGTSGCVGCGRCVTWCPAGIDLAEEAAGAIEGVSS